MRIEKNVRINGRPLGKETFNLYFKDKSTYFLAAIRWHRIFQSPYSPLGIPSRCWSFSKDWNDANKAWDIFWLVPGVNGGIAALLGISAKRQLKNIKSRSRSVQRSSTAHLWGRAYIARSGWSQVRQQVIQTRSQDGAWNQGKQMKKHFAVFAIYHLIIA